MTDEIKMICDSISSICDTVAIILYGTKYTPSGNRLREANFCVVVSSDAKESEKDLYRRLDIDFPFNLLVYDKESWARLTDDPTSYASSILEKGELLYGIAKR